MPNKDTATRNKQSSERPRVHRAPAPSTATPQRGPVSMRQLIQRTLDDPSSLTTVDGAHLQRSIGNRAVGQILAASAAAKRAANPGATVVQTKLTLGPAGDKYEQEADRTAKQVMRSLDAPAAQTDAAPDETLRAKLFDTSLAALQANGMARVAREYSAGLAQRRQSGEGSLQAKPLADGISRIQRAEMEEDELQMKRQAGDVSRIQRAGMEEDEDELQAKPLHGPEGGEVDPGVAATIGSAKGDGQPLHDGVRASMERGFGADFSGVRVHTGGQADALNRSLNARAFTSGRDLFFRQGEYNPGSRGGQELIAHELTHTVQQGATGVERENGKETVQRKLTSRAERAFTEAEKTNQQYWQKYRGYTDKYVPTGHQDQLSTLRSATKRIKESPEDEKRLKDYLRAFLLSEYSKRLKTLYTSKKSLVEYNTKKKQNERRDFYFDKAKDLRDKFAPLVEKGVGAPETKSFLNMYGFDKHIKVSKERTKQAMATGPRPRIDVRSTFIGSKILGVGVRAHLFIVYTSQDGRQMYFRGGPDKNPVPNQPPPMAVANYGLYVPGTVDFDPSAPSVTILQGPQASAKLDALIEAASVIDAMHVPYQAKIGKGLTKKGENCNSVAWTILTRAGIAPQKPSGHHPGWGTILGSQTKGKEHVLPKKEEFEDTSENFFQEYNLDPRFNKTDRFGSVLVYHDRNLFQQATKLHPNFPVQLLGESDKWRRIKYSGKIGYVMKEHKKDNPLLKNTKGKNIFEEIELDTDEKPVSNDKQQKAYFGNNIFDEIDLEVQEQNNNRDQKEQIGGNIFNIKEDLDINFFAEEETDNSNEHEKLDINFFEENVEMKLGEGNQQDDLDINFFEDSSEENAGNDNTEEDFDINFFDENEEKNDN